MAKQFTLGKNERLKSRKSIEQLFSDGKKFMVAPYKVLYKQIPSAGKPTLLFAAAVSAKNFKRAVDRNRVKRITREAYRLQKKSLQKKVEAGTDHLHVFFIYTARDLPEYSEVAKKMALALDKLEKMIPS